MMIEGTVNRPRVLLADDHALLLGAFEKLLKRMSPRVRQACIGFPSSQ